MESLEKLERLLKQKKECTQKVKVLSLQAEQINDNLKVTSDTLLKLNQLMKDLNAIPEKDEMRIIGSRDLETRIDFLSKEIEETIVFKNAFENKINQQIEVCSALVNEINALKKKLFPYS